MNLNEHPHRRFNPLTGDWVLVSPQRTKRPWQGQTDAAESEQMPRHDPGCYLCPGNVRANGQRNPDYEGVFVFTNDFSTLLPDTPLAEERDEDGLFAAVTETGGSRVICFSPRHDLTLSRMDVGGVTRVIDAWVDEFQTLGGRPDIGYVQIFENRGAMMGCSNPHPHGQIWAGRSVPDLPARETLRQAAFLKDKGQCLLCRYLAEEIRRGERLVLENDSFVVLVPYWAVWPFETMVLPRAHLAHIGQMTEAQRRDLADILIRLGTRYDNLFRTPFPYSSGFHQAPTDGPDHPEWHFHMHYLPPLLRSAAVRKFMVGYELLARPQRDITAEQSAGRLRELPEIHYLNAGDAA